MDLSIISVTWNSEKFIKKQIESVKLFCDSIEYEQIVIDNNSTDNTVELLKQSSVQLVVNATNRGFAAANNQGAKTAKGDYLLFLNPDMELTADTKMKEMIDFMKANTNCGIMSCKLVDGTGKTNRYEGVRRFPKIWQMLALILKIPHVFPFILNSYHYRDVDLSTIQEVDSVRGSFMLVKKEIIVKLGRAFDERYFIWLEDVDLCREVVKMGYKIVYNPVFTCIDLVGRSFSKVNNLKKQIYFMNSLLIYFQKWEPRYKWIWIKIFKPVGIFLVWLFKG